MSDVKYTPGPWEMLPNGLLITRSRTDNQSIGSYQWIAYGEQQVDEHPGNCLLIAAAPELLAACKTVLRLLEEGALVRNISDDGAADWPVRMLKFVQELNQLTTAVAKAEGR